MAVSPDGKTVAYTTQSDLAAFYWDGKETFLLGYDITPVAIANNGRFVYYARGNTLYAQRGANADTRTRLGELTHSNDLPLLGQAIVFNKTLSQAMYTPDGRTYISRRAGEREILPGKLTNFLLPYRSYAVNNFSNTYYLNTEGDVIHINRRHQANTVAGGVSHAVISSNGRQITYLKDHTLFKQKSGNEPIRLTANTIVAFTGTANGDAVYFMDNEGGLFYQKGEQSPVLINDDWRNNLNGYEIPGLFRGNQLLYINGYDLRMASSGRCVRVRGLEGDVVSFGADAHRVWVQTVVRQSGGTVSHYYFSTNGTRFVRVGTLEVVN
jgi:hypothetical protein